MCVVCVCVCVLCMSACACVSVCCILLLSRHFLVRRPRRTSLRCGAIHSTFNFVFDISGFMVCFQPRMYTNLIKPASVHSTRHYSSRNRRWLLPWCPRNMSCACSISKMRSWCPIDSFKARATSFIRALACVRVCVCACVCMSVFVFSLPPALSLSCPLSLSVSVCLSLSFSLYPSPPCGCLCTFICIMHAWCACMYYDEPFLRACTHTFLICSWSGWSGAVKLASSLRSSCAQNVMPW